MLLRVNRKSLKLIVIRLCIPICLYGQPDSTNVSYGSHYYQKLDYWEAETTGSPTVVLIHGGFWHSGSKDSNRLISLGNRLVNNCFGVVNMNYRLSSDSLYTGFPSQVNDIFDVVLWIKENSELLNTDPNKIILLGNSAGAHLATIVSLMANRQVEGVFFNELMGVIAISGLFSFEDIQAANVKNAIDLMLRNQRYWDQAQPINLIKTTSIKNTKFLIIQGKNDRLTGSTKNLSFSKYLSDRGLESELVIVDSAGHNLWPMVQDSTSYLSQRIYSFLESLDYQITGIEKNDHGVSVFPNPCTDLLYISAGKQIIKNVNLFRLDGEKVDIAPKQCCEMIVYDLSHLKRGVYLVRIEINNNKTISSKVILE